MEDSKNNGAKEEEFFLKRKISDFMDYEKELNEIIESFRKLWPQIRTQHKPQRNDS